MRTSVLGCVLLRKPKDLTQRSQKKGGGKSEKDRGVDRRDEEKGGGDPSLRSGWLRAKESRRGKPRLGRFAGGH